MTDAPAIAIIGDSFRPGVIDGAAAYCLRNALTLDPRWACRPPLLHHPPSADGLLSLIPQHLPLPGWLAETRTPTVHLTPRAGTIWVSTDYGACTRLALAEFADQGICSVCFLQVESAVMDPPSGGDPSATAGCQGLRCLPIRLSRRGGDLRSVAREIAEVLAAMPLPCGFYDPDADLAYSLIEALAGRGLRVPDDVAIITTAGEHDRTCCLAPVPLTAVQKDDWMVGFEGARMLHGLINGSPPARPELLVRPAGLSRRSSSSRPGTTDPLIRRALTIMQSPYGGTLRTGELAHQLAVARRTLEIRFRRATGTTIHQALTQQRMAAARKLLEDPSPISLQTIAQRCGFSSPAYFITAFRRSSGTTPQAWRRQTREKAADSRAPVPGHPEIKQPGPSIPRQPAQN